MKEIFEEPEFEVICFKGVDIITTSDIQLDPDELPPVAVN